MKEKIEKMIAMAIKKASIPDMPEISVEIPADPRHGDYASSVALALAKKLQKNPMNIAAEITAHIAKDVFIEKAEATPPGFINFYLSGKFFSENLIQLLNTKKTGKSTSLKGKKIIVEYTDPNPFKEFHIGHLMSNAVGESIARFYEFQGATVKRACYQGDVGLHVAKAIWGKMQQPKLHWGQAYAYGAHQFEKHKQEITALNKKIYDRSDKKINRLYDQGKKVSLAEFGKIYKKLGTKFDYYFFESETGELGKKIVGKYIGKVFERGENGAIIFTGEKYGLHTRVFINAEGLPTYEAKELGLAEIKYKKFKYDESVVITANEVNEYFKVLLAAMGQVFPKLAEKTKHFGHGMMRLPEGKMSSRTGNVVTGESLLNEVQNIVLEKMKNRHVSQREKQKIANQVAVAAIKYPILKQKIGSDIVYRPDQAVSLEGDSGPYLQYSYVRAVSVLEKAKKEGVKRSLKNPEHITMLEKKICRFAHVASAATIHQMALYLTELAATFNTYYAEHKIVDKQDEFSPYRVAITEIFSKVMKNGLWLLGIEAPEHM